MSQIPSGGLSGSNHCIYEVSVTKAEKKTFVTLQGRDLNAFGDSEKKGIDGFQQAILRSLYRSQREKRELIHISEHSQMERSVFHHRNTSIAIKMIGNLEKSVFGGF